MITHTQCRFIRLNISLEFLGGTDMRQLSLEEVCQKAMAVKSHFHAGLVLKIVLVQHYCACTTNQPKRMVF